MKKYIIFLFALFCFASLAAIEIDFEGGAVLPSESFDTGKDGNDIFGAQSTGGGTRYSSPFGGSSSASSNSNSSSSGGGTVSGGGILGGLSGLFNKSSNTTRSLVFSTGSADDTDPISPPDAGIYENPLAYNDAPIGDSISILLMFSLVYLIIRHKKRGVF